MDYIPTIDTYVTLGALLKEDFEKNKVFSINEIKNRYEGWILYIIARGNPQDIISLANDIQIVSKLDREQILNLVESLTAEISISFQMKFLFNQIPPYFYSFFKTNMSSSHCNAPLKLDSNRESMELDTAPLENPIIATDNSCIESDNAQNNNSNIALPSVQSENLPQIPSKVELNENIYEITEYFLCSHFYKDSIDLEAIDYSNIPKSASRISCTCNNRTNCSNSAFCTCAKQFANISGSQRGLLIINGKKLLPRDWKENYAIIECTSQCPCDKNKCYQTFFDDNFNAILDMCIF